MSDVSQWASSLEKEFIAARGVRTAVYVSPYNKGKPIALFVHGINGSHYGLVPLAMLSKNYQAILIDLPGHGNTEVPDDYFMDMASVRAWFQEVYDAISVKYGGPSKVVAHSFGGYAASVLEKALHDEVVLICPVPSTSRFYKIVTWFSRRIFSVSFMARLYNSLVFSTVRGYVLLRIRTKKNFRLNRDLSMVDRNTTARQRIYQARLTRISSDKNIFDGFNPQLVIIGLKDRLPRERTVQQMRKIFPNSKIKPVAGGHLAPIENAKTISDIIGL